MYMSMGSIPAEGIRDGIVPTRLLDANTCSRRKGVRIRSYAHAWCRPGPRAWDACTLHAMYVFELVHLRIHSMCLRRCAAEHMAKSKTDVCNHPTMII